MDDKATQQSGMSGGQMERGSAEILKRRGGRTFDEKQLKMVYELFRRADLELLDFFPHGQPDPDWVRATVRLKPDQFASLGKLMPPDRSAVVRGIRIFPRGIPWPEWFEANIDIVPPLQEDFLGPR